MNKFYHTLCKVTSRVCVGALALLGFGCTDENGEGDEPEFMYGTPTAEFEVKGMVTDAEGKEVQDVEVKVTESNRSSSKFSIVNVRPGENGIYRATGTKVGSPNDELKIVCIPDDKSLEPDSAIVTLNKISDGEGAWDTGKGEATVDFKLKKKVRE